jgi:hypothetical protein
MHSVLAYAAAYAIFLPSRGWSDWEGALFCIRCQIEWSCEVFLADIRWLAGDRFAACASFYLLRVAAAIPGTCVLRWRGATDRAIMLFRCGSSGFYAAAARSGDEPGHRRLCDLADVDPTPEAPAAGHILLARHFPAAHSAACHHPSNLISPVLRTLPAILS